MHCETVSGMAFLRWKNALWNSFRDCLFAAAKKTQLDTSCLCYSIKCQTRGVPEVIVHKGTQQLACLVIIQSGCSGCPPQKIPWMRARLVWVPGYHSFFAKRISIYNTFPSVRSNHMVNVFITDQLRLFLPKHYVIRFSNLTSPWAPDLGHVTALRWFLSKRT